MLVKTCQSFSFLHLSADLNTPAFFSSLSLLSFGVDALFSTSALVSLSYDGLIYTVSSFCFLFSFFLIYSLAPAGCVILSGNNNCNFSNKHVQAYIHTYCHLSPRASIFHDWSTLTTSPDTQHRSKTNSSPALTSIPIVILDSLFFVKKKRKRKIPYPVSFYSPPSLSLFSPQ